MPETSGWIIVTEIIPGCEASKRHYDQQPRFSCATRSAVRTGVTIGLLGLVLMVRFAMPSSIGGERVRTRRTQSRAGVAALEAGASGFWLLRTF